MIYRALLKEQFEELPPILRAFHSAPGLRYARGMLSIRRDSSFLAWLVGFPPEAEHVPVALEVLATEHEETWTRSFGGFVRCSTQRVERGLLTEKAGPLRIDFRVAASTEALTFTSRKAQIWGIPAPLRVEAWARGAAASWEIEVRIAHVGCYRGVMTPKL